MCPWHDHRRMRRIVQIALDEPLGFALLLLDLQLEQIVLENIEDLLAIFEALEQRLAFLL